MSVPGTPERDAVRHAPDLPGVLPEGPTTEDERLNAGTPVMLELAARWITGSTLTASCCSSPPRRPTIERLRSPCPYSTSTLNVGTRRTSRGVGADVR